MKLIQRANKGRGLETAVLASAGSLIRVTKIGHMVKYLAGGKTVAQPSPPDFIGCVTANGRMIAFDAKECADEKRWPINPWLNSRRHQYQFLSAYALDGAIAGLLVESKAKGRYFWLDVLAAENHAFHEGQASIPWDHRRWIDLGPTTHAIQFQNIPGVLPPRAVL